MPCPLFAWLQPKLFPSLSLLSVRQWLSFRLPRQNVYRELASPMKFSVPSLEQRADQDLALAVRMLR